MPKKKSGWFGERQRHREAALKGGRNRLRRIHGKPLSKRRIETAQRKRSERSKGQDIEKKADTIIQPNTYGAWRWKKNPDRYDVEGVDVRRPKDMAEHYFNETDKLTEEEKIRDANRLDRDVIEEPDYQDVEYWKKNINEVDIRGTDTPSEAPKVQEGAFTAQDKESARGWLEDHPSIKKKAAKNGRLFELETMVAEMIAESDDPSMVDWESYITDDLSIRESLEEERGV